MKKITVVIPSFKNKKWCRKNIESVINQTHDNYSIIYTDDKSPDGTADAVWQVVQEHSAEGKFTLIRNEQRLGAMQNLYNMIHSCEDDEIILTLDGDDWLAHDKVLEKIDEAYSDSNVWFTWGSYVDWPNNTRGCCKPIPRAVLDARNYRRQPWCTSHLRTFKAKLFKLIKKEDFYGPDGKFLDAAWDLAFFMPFVDMAGHHGRYIHDILYIYNHENPIQDFKIKLSKQAAMDRYIRMKPRYPKIESL